MNANGSNGAPSWKVVAGVAVGLISVLFTLLLALLTFVSKGVAEDVKDHEKRITVLEVDLYNKVADLEEAVQDLTKVVGVVRDSLNTRYQRRNP